MKILQEIGNIADPRMEGKVLHKLSSIIFVSLCGVLCGCESWGDIKDYCETKIDWLSRYVKFPNGVPSEYTFRRVFTLLNPENVESLLRTHASEVIAQQGKKSGQIAIDGKTLRGSKKLNLQCIHSVSAWCHENGLVIGERQVDSKSNEITAIPLLLESLDIKGSTITIDAAGCQKNITERIVEGKGNYVLGLKRNHPKLYDAVKKLITKRGEHANNCLNDSFEEGHGKAVRRRYFGYDVTDLPEIKEWKMARSVVAVETIVSKNNDPKHMVSKEWRYYLSNLKCTDTMIPSYIRNHWGIENKLHWVLDVHLKEDNDTKAERKSTRSFALLKRIALNIVRSKDTTPKKSLRRKLKHPAWDDKYLISILT